MFNAYDHVQVDDFWYEDATFLVVKLNGYYVFVPHKIIKMRNFFSKTIYVHVKIWVDRYYKAREDVAKNNLCDLYFTPMMAETENDYDEDDCDSCPG